MLAKTEKQLLMTNKKSYDAIARDFSVTRNYVWDDLNIFLKYIKDGDNVLDLGCGNGRLVDLLKNKNVAYLGVDYSKGLIDQAKQKYPDNKFRVMDSLDLKLPRESFDAVITTAVLNHFPTRQMQLAFLQNIKNVLKPGGYLLMSNWNLWNKNNKKGTHAFNLEKNKLSDEEFEIKYGFDKNDLSDKDVLTIWGGQQILYYYAFDIAVLKELLEESGFEVVGNFYSKDGRKAGKVNGDNIITIAKIR